ncbi:MAG TPA: hypothetical protein VMH39_14820, partial [Gemmatimonadaceae bacterium]|nr:hypothetical protein [Gemmatimonadaceae bacterium]
MRWFPVLAAVVVSASPVWSQDTVVVRHVGAPPDSVVVRHLGSPADTTVVVRHLAPQDTSAARQPAAPQGTVPLVRRIPPPPPGGPRAVIVPRPLAYSFPPKDPALGTSLSMLIPGGGQFYAGKPGEGMALLLLGYGAPIVGVIQSQNEYDGSSYSCDRGSPFGGQGYRCRGNYDAGPALVGIGVGLGAWIYSIATAGTDVARWNQ